MLELALDTLNATSVALVRDGEAIARAEDGSARHHAESLTPLVRRVLQDAGLGPDAAGAGLDRVLVGTGPAPFTGLRAGLVSARVIGEAVGAPVLGVASLDVVARQGLDLLPPDMTVFAVSDARRRELYWGRYEADGPDDVRLVGRLEVGAAHALLGAMREADGLIVAAGPLPAHSAQLLADASQGPVIDLDPAVMSRVVAARLARGQEERLGTQPLYLRRPDIQGRAPARL